MTTYFKIIIAFTIIILTGTGFWLYADYQRIWENAIERFKAENVVYLQEKIVLLFDPAVFEDTNAERQKRTLGNLWTFIQSPDIVRIKIWDKNFTVIWSNLTDIIGKRFSDNHEVKEALEGKIEFEIIKKGKSENIFEREFRELSEIYLPVGKTNGEIVGVLEIYRPTLTIREEIREEFQERIFIVVLLVILILVAVAFILRLVMKPALR